MLYRRQAHLSQVGNCVKRLQHQQTEGRDTWGSVPY